MLYESGGKYVGNLKNNKRHGEGIYTYPNLEELNFSIIDPKKIIDKNNFCRILFSGEWDEDLKVRGVIIYADGSLYEGEIFDDEPHGKGKLKNIHYVYEGDFKNGKMDGHGT